MWQHVIKWYTEKLVDSCAVAEEPNGFQSNDDDYGDDDNVENDNKDNDGDQVHYNRDCTYSSTKVSSSNTFMHPPLLSGVSAFEVPAHMPL
ncbi:hypothetical protein KQX54_017588 [Cotesia glomerata]|uniref:Uncharacterized protein n=1 Tax=Cotesia glomerata TaxID=32391 RepID=A0AAV7I0B8_COTGL|nr:hypothetical protein KQX54_017588 [Cotesia glomerata]